MRITVELEVETAAALLAVASSYGSDSDYMDTEIGKRLAVAVEPLQDVVTREQAADAQELLRAAWSDA